MYVFLFNNLLSPDHLFMYWIRTVKPACTSLMITQKRDEFCGHRVPPVTGTSSPPPFRKAMQTGEFQISETYKEA